jgi:predicted nucleotidyltransferase
MARDVLLGHVFGLNPGRATRDVDVALALADWEQFHQVKEKLIASGGFVAARDIPHRLVFSSDSDAQQCMVDLLPFGGITRTTDTIAWPPDMQMIMSVAGYSDALETALLVQIATGLTIRVVSLPGLAMLKLLAWKERGLEDSRDATDLVTLCRYYADAGTLERLYEEALPILPTVGFDVELASAWLLGTDTAVTTSYQTRVQLETLLSDVRISERLVNDMAKALRRREDAVAYATQLLDQFTRGFLGQAVP